PGLNQLPRSAGSAGSLRRWGSLQGGLGVCIIVASTALGAIATMVTGRTPGLLLGVFVVIGTIAAALAVRPRAGRMILPVPVLSYLVAALISGVIYNRGDGASKTALALGAAQWIADGFFAMAMASALAMGLITVRWLLWRRQRKTAPTPGWTSPAPGQVRRPPRPPVSLETAADAGYPARYRDPGSTRDGSIPGSTRDGGIRGPGSTRGGGGNAGWNDPASGGPDPGSPRLPGYRRPGPRPGSGPYNFSSGA
ncbi:MAG: hypothetical protein M3Z75_05105, partial [Actinomycetota bacterium]|nr:hypothetical protein [Actinomycetota bacterium]